MKPLSMVEKAVLKSKIREDLQMLRTSAGLHAYTGNDGEKLANLAGRLLFITAYAAGKEGLGDTPEANILAGSASALGDIAEGTASVEAQRGAVISGLAAVERLLPKLTIKFIAEGHQYLEAMLASPHGLTHQDVIDVLERK